MLKKILLKVLNVLSILMIICSLGVLLTVVMTKQGEAPNVFGDSLFRVMTGSMEPNIPTNSLIVVRRAEPAELATGDVISFYSRDPSLMGEVNTHRIVRIEKVGERYVLTTKGDANNVEDQYVTYGEDVIGKVVFSSYRLGQAVRLISNPIIFIPLIIIPLVIAWGDYMASELYNSEDSFMWQLRKAGFRTVFTGRGLGAYEEFRKVDRKSVV